MAEVVRGERLTVGRAPVPVWPPVLVRQHWAPLRPFSPLVPLRWVYNYPSAGRQPASAGGPGQVGSAPAPRGRFLVVCRLVIRPAAAVVLGRESSRGQWWVEQDTSRPSPDRRGV